MSLDFGWRVHVGRDSFGRNDTLMIYRQGSAESTIVVTGIGSDQYSVDSVPDGVRASPLRLPEGVLAAIAEAIKPGSSDGEIKRLEEALAIERRRVDDLLAVFSGRQ